jgi:hypothetical protein
MITSEEDKQMECVLLLQLQRSAFSFSGCNFEVMLKKLRVDSSVMSSHLLDDEAV